MPKKPDARIAIAKEMYLQGRKLIDISTELDLPEGTVRRWKSTHKWDNERSDKNNANVRKKRGGQPGNKNATGPPGNQNARKHGLFARYVQPDVLAIMNDIKHDNMNQLDMLMDSIEFWYAKIVKAQEIMYVRDRDDTTRVITMEGEDVTAYQVEFSWDKQANEIKALSRAFSTLNSLIRQYDELSKSIQQTELQKARIDLLKAQYEKIKTDKSDNGAELQRLDDILSSIDKVAKQ